MTRATTLAPLAAKEIRALLPFLGASVAALAAVSVWREGGSSDLGVAAYAAGSLAIGAQSVGQEYTFRTLPMLLTQPTDRQRVYLLKLAVAAVMLLALAVVAAATFGSAWRPEGAQIPVVILPALCGLFVAPLLTMICRSTLAGMMLSGSLMAITWLVTLAIAWFVFGIEPAAVADGLIDRWSLGVMVVCPLFGVLGWRRFMGLEAAEAASQALHLPQWLKRVQGARRHAPIRALALKELHLLQPALVLAGVYAISWAAVLVIQRSIPSWSTFPIDVVMGLYCLGLPILVGALASAEERQLGMLDWQLLQPAPAWQQWTVKAGVTLGVALLCGVVLPLLLNQLAPLERGAGLHAAGHLAVLVVLLSASSLYLSSLCSSGVRAMVLLLPIGLTVVVFVRLVGGAMHWATRLLAGPWTADIVTGAVVVGPVSPADVALSATRVVSLVLVPVLLWCGFVNHRSAERPARRLVHQIATIALLITTAIVLVGAVLASSEPHPRY